MEILNNLIYIEASKCSVAGYLLQESSSFIGATNYGQKESRYIIIISKNINCQYSNKIMSIKLYHIAIIMIENAKCPNLSIYLYTLKPTITLKET